MTVLLALLLALFPGPAPPPAKGLGRHELLWESPSVKVYGIQLGHLEKTAPWMHTRPTILIPITLPAGLQQRDARLLPLGPTQNIYLYRQGGVRVLAAPAAHVFYNIDLSRFIGIEIESASASFGLIPRFTRAASQTWTDGSVTIQKTTLTGGESSVHQGGNCLVLALDDIVVVSADDGISHSVRAGRAAPIRFTVQGQTQIGRRLLTICEDRRLGPVLASNQDR